jgi:hypothetical protein
VADIQRYIDLITSEHADKPKFIAWLTAALNVLDDAVKLADVLCVYFDLDAAAGAQLDVLGEIVGVSRTVDFQPSDGSSPVLDDETYRLVIRAKIAQNQWDGTLQQIYDLWNNIFPLQKLVLTDNQDMTMDAIVFGVSSGIQQDLVANGYIVPKPQGVFINYAFSQYPVFAYDLDTDVFKGYDEGYWIQYL